MTEFIRQRMWFYMFIYWIIFTANQNCSQMRKEEIHRFVHNFMRNHMRITFHNFSLLDFALSVTNSGTKCGTAVENSKCSFCCFPAQCGTSGRFMIMCYVVTSGVKMNKFDFHSIFILISYYYYYTSTYHCILFY